MCRTAPTRRRPFRRAADVMSEPGRADVGLEVVRDASRSLRGEVGHGVVEAGHRRGAAFSVTLTVPVLYGGGLGLRTSRIASPSGPEIITAGIVTGSPSEPRHERDAAEPGLQDHGDGAGLLGVEHLRRAGAVAVAGVALEDDRHEAVERVRRQRRAELLVGRPGVARRRRRVELARVHHVGRQALGRQIGAPVLRHHEPVVGERDAARGC